MNPTIRTTTAALGIVLAATGLAGCGGNSNASPAPSTTTTSSAPTTPTATPTPSTNPQVTEAIAVYKKSFTTINAYFAVGGMAPGNAVPDGIKETMADQALKDAISEQEQVYQLGLVRQSGTTVLGKIRVSAKQRAGATIALDSCEDGSSIVNKRADGSTSHGRLIYKTSYFAPVKGKLMIIYYYGEQVKTCPIK